MLENGRGRRIRHIHDMEKRLYPVQQCVVQQKWLDGCLRCLGSLFIGNGLSYASRSARSRRVDSPTRLAWMDESHNFRQIVFTYPVFNVRPKFGCAIILQAKTSPLRPSNHPTSHAVKPSHLSDRQTSHFTCRQTTPRLRPSNIPPLVPSNYPTSCVVKPSPLSCLKTRPHLLLHQKKMPYSRRRCFVCIRTCFTIGHVLQCCQDVTSRYLSN